MRIHLLLPLLLVLASLAAGQGQTPSWSLFGTGHPGSLGVPAIALDGPPAIGATVNVLMGNSFGLPTHGCLLFGDAMGTTPTPLGFDALIQNPLMQAVNIEPQGGVHPVPIANDPALCGNIYYLQILVFDPLASSGISASQGLIATIGCP